MVRPDHDTLPEQGDVTLDDSVQGYFLEIGRTPLLNRNEEVDLAQQIEAATSARQQMGEYPNLPPAQQRELEQIVTAGEEARRQLIQANLRLVVSVARRYHGRGLPLMDLIQEGNIGLMRAVEKFDHTRGNKFSTYATWWIKQAITRAIDEQNSTIRVPVHHQEKLRRLARLRQELQQDSGEPATRDALATALNLAPAQVDALLASEHIAHPVSLDMPVGDDLTVLDCIVEEDRTSTEGLGLAHRIELSSHIEALFALANLTEREQRIIERRHMISPGTKVTLDSVGKELGLTRERVRQLERLAFKKLRDAARTMGLSPETTFEGGADIAASG